MLRRLPAHRLKMLSKVPRAMQPPQTDVQWSLEAAGPDVPAAEARDLEERPRLAVVRCRLLEPFSVMVVDLELALVLNTSGVSCFCARSDAVPHNKHECREM